RSVASPESIHCQLWYGLTVASLGTNALGHSWPRGPCNQGGQGTAPAGGPILVQQDLVLGACAPVIDSSLAHYPEKGPPPSGEGQNLAPASRSLEPPSMVPGRDQEDSRDFHPQ
ncbi:hypothetical protein M9458_015191, partial [Cirrhinus mrigala]